MPKKQPDMSREEGGAEEVQDSTLSVRAANPRRTAFASGLPG
jgi:hypothetical protein